MLLLLLAASLAYEPSAFVRIMGKRPIAQGCVVEGKLLTAEHVVGSYKLDPVVAWSDLDGREGRAGVAAVSTGRDLAILDGRVGPGLPRAPHPPLPGEKIRLYGYTRSGDNPLKPKVTEAEVAGISAGHVLFKGTSSPPAHPGDSGGCMVNEKGEVVALIIARWDYAEQRVTVIGVGLWGMWNPLVPPNPEPFFTLGSR